MPDAPVLLVIDDDPRTRGVVERELHKRYGADYELICAESADDPARLLAELSGDRRLVAIVLAAQWLAQMTGTQVLARVHEYHPTAKRVLLADWGDQATYEPIQHAIGLDQLDTYLAPPAAAPDERFHRAITELLEEWARSHLPGLEAVRVVGEQWSPSSHEIRELLGRNGIPFGFYPADAGQAKALLEQAGAVDAALPVVILSDGHVLESPSRTEVASALGAHTSPGAGLYDVAVIGAGPAGLSAAVYGASEGLSTVVLEPEATGGQAGTSACIRNYLGFPTGISGEDLANRASTQAWNFGAEYVYGSPATGLSVEGSRLVVTVAGGSQVRSRAVVIATGVSYRRLGIPTLEALTGVGVFYGAAASEAKAMKEREVFVVGGANSAGQAAVHLASYAARVTVLARGQSLTAGMSDYLVKKIASTPNIAVRCNVELVDGAGTGRLETLTVQDRVSGATETVPASAVFVLIGAEPHTQWLPGEVERDRWGFIVTGSDLLAAGHPPEAWPLRRPPMLLESSVPGVFAVGDVRRGSVKRVASAVGEGSIVIYLISHYLQGN